MNKTPSGNDINRVERSKWQSCSACGKFIEDSNRGSIEQFRCDRSNCFLVRAEYNILPDGTLVFLGKWKPQDHSMIGLIFWVLAGCAIWYGWYLWAPPAILMGTLFFRRYWSLKASLSKRTGSLHVVINDDKLSRQEVLDTLFKNVLAVVEKECDFDDKFGLGILVRNRGVVKIAEDEKIRQLSHLLASFLGVPVQKWKHWDSRD